MRILISFAGGTDPVASNAYDGPLLHIVRHYRPDYVKLLLTQEMTVLAEKDNRYESALRSLCLGMNHECKVESVKTGIRDAHDFDIFRAVVLAVFNDLKNTWPEAEFLFNISSGTPQITATLCLTAVSLGGVKVIQVATPAAAMNAGTKHNRDFDENTMENNLDNLDQPDRCLEPDIMVFRKTMVTSRLRELVDNYDYAAALRLMRQEKDLGWPESLLAAIRHGAERLNLKSREALEQSRLMPGFDAYPVHFKRAVNALEYYLASKVKQHRGELGDFILRLSPLLQYLLEEYVRQNTGFNLDWIQVINKNIAYVKPELVKRKYPQLYDYLCSEYSSGSGFRYAPVNSDILLRIAAYLSIGRNCGAVSTNRCNEAGEVFLPRYNETTGGMPVENTILGDFTKLRDMERDVRNRLAHQMTAVTERDLRDECGITSLQVCKMLEKSIIQLFKGYVKYEAFAVYDRLNEYISAQLESI